MLESSIAQCRRNRWPVPEKEVLAHSERLSRKIHQQIEHVGGWMPFSDYMKMALYQPGLGYYSAGSRKFGEGGDFVTAPEISSLFGYSLAASMRGVARQLGAEYCILEFGAGTGKLASDILFAMAETECLPLKYQILEVSADLKQVQQQHLAKVLSAEIFDRIEWLSSLPAHKENVLVIANEVADAIPFELYQLNEKNELLQSGVSCLNDQLIAHWKPLSVVSESLENIKEKIIALEPVMPYFFEHGEQALAWYRSLLGCFRRSAIWIIDYGFGANELYLAERSCGTLMCHYQHRGHGDPLFFPGLQDITYHINFSDLAYAAKNARWDVQAFTTQADFLLSNGILDLCAGFTPEEQYAAATQIRRLTSPSEMGEVFKVLIVSQDIDDLAQIFPFNNRWHQL